MSRDEMIKRLESLPHPIIEDVVFSDMGCEFSILTPKKGYYCVVGSNFPIFGPFKILPGGKFRHRFRPDLFTKPKPALGEVEIIAAKARPPTRRAIPAEVLQNC